MNKVENKRVQLYRSCIFIRLKRIASLQIVEKEIGKDAFKNMMKHSAVISSLNLARTQTFHLNSNNSVSWVDSLLSILLLEPVLSNGVTSQRLNKEL